MTTHVNFVVLGHARCGSNLLVRALAEHPQVRMAGEILAPDQRIRDIAWQRVNRISWPLHRGPGYQTGQNAAEFLDREVFATGVVENSRAFGFKLFYEHAQWDAPSRTAWDYLIAHREIRVIHLTRRNLLDALISQEVAIRTDRWHQLVEEGEKKPPPLPPFALDPDFCQRYFDATVEHREAAAKIFAAHPTFPLEYEADLCAGFRAITARVFEFIEVMPWLSRPGLIKQQGLAAAQQIANFNDLRRHFRGSPYIEFFEQASRPESLASARP